MLISSIFLFFFILTVNANNLDSDGKKLCLAEHNRYRSELANGNVKSATKNMPSAGDMNELVSSLNMIDY